MKKMKFKFLQLRKKRTAANDAINTVNAMHKYQRTKIVASKIKNHVKHNKTN